MTPFTETNPRARTRPARHLRKVVFPEPEGPVTTVIPFPGRARLKTNFKLSPFLGVGKDSSRFTSIAMDLYPSAGAGLIFREHHFLVWCNLEMITFLGSFVNGIFKGI
jgi:hypothetical protein